MAKLMSVVLGCILLNLSAFAAKLDGFARHYGERCATSATEVNSEQMLPAKFRSRNFSVILERTTLMDIQQQFKGRIQKNSHTEWLCYHSQAENLTWWFLSRTDIEHGKLSAIMLAPFDSKAKCDIPARPVYLSGMNIPLLGASRGEVARHFKTATVNPVTCQRFITVAQSKDEKTINRLSYYYEKDQVMGISIEQLTTNR